MRFIFQRYLELGCLTKLARDLREKGICTKVRRRSDGSLRGAIPFTKGPLAYLLKNRVYAGDIVHKGRFYPGEHEPIIQMELFEAVQQRLASQAQRRGRGRINGESILSGRIFDDRGNRMTPSTARKGSVHYRYYVSAALLLGRNEDAGSIPRVPAPDIERAVIVALKNASEARLNLGNVPDQSLSTDADLIRVLLDKAVIRKNAIEVTLRGETDSRVGIEVPWSAATPKPRREILLPPSANGQQQRAIRSESRARLIQGIAKGRLWLTELLDGPGGGHERNRRPGGLQRPFGPHDCQPRILESHDRKGGG